MVELSLEGWTAAQREGLGFLVDDAGIDAVWGPSSISVSEDAQARTRRFINFLTNAPDESGAESDPAPDARPVRDRWARDEPQLLFTDDLGISDVATPGLRFAGFLVDGVVSGVFMLLAYLATDNVATTGWLSYGFSAAYHILMVSLLGRTLGNMAVHTRVMKTRDRSVPGLRAGFVRWLVPQLGSLLMLALSWPRTAAWPWTLAVYLPVLSGPSYRGLHDRASGVMVINEPLVTPAVAAPTDDPNQPVSE